MAQWVKIEIIVRHPQNSHLSGVPVFLPIQILADFRLSQERIDTVLRIFRDSDIKVAE